MSSYQSDKCSKEALQQFKQEVLKWLNKHFDISKLKIKAYTCYNGDVRIYTGDYTEFINKKTSFRRTESKKDESGKIIGWKGLRGHHETRWVDYISINRDEFEDIKNVYRKKDKNSDEYFFMNDLIFSKLSKFKN